jgi:hypothetical protein
MNQNNLSFVISQLSLFICDIRSIGAKEVSGLIADDK